MAGVKKGILAPLLGLGRDGFGCWLGEARIEVGFGVGGRIGLGLGCDAVLCPFPLGLK